MKLPGQRLMARDFDRQASESQVRVAVLNGSTAPGTPVTDGGRGNSARGKGTPDHHLICATEPGLRHPSGRKSTRTLPSGDRLPCPRKEKWN